MPDQIRPYDPLTSENAALVLIDHQVGLMTGVRDYSTGELKHNVVALAKAAKPVLGGFSFFSRLCVGRADTQLNYWTERYSTKKMSRNGTPGRSSSNFNASSTSPRPVRCVSTPLTIARQLPPRHTCPL